MDGLQKVAAGLALIWLLLFSFNQFKKHEFDIDPAEPRTQVSEKNADKLQKEINKFLEQKYGK